MNKTIIWIVVLVLLGGSALVYKNMDKAPEGEATRRFLSQNKQKRRLLKKKIQKPQQPQQSLQTAHKHQRQNQK